MEVILKLLIDSKANKVLFAEVGKDFVDFLFQIMSLPVGTIIKLLSVDSTVDNSLGALYKSIESLSSDYLQPYFSKYSVLDPRAPVTVPLLAPNLRYKLHYRCNNTRRGCASYYTDCQYATPCPKCGRQMNTEMKYVAPPASSTGGGGYVKGLVNYMVMDNLEVKPMSAISGITLINKFRVKDVSALEEKEILVGFKEGKAILKASLEVSNTVLTTVFCSKEI